MNKKWDNYFLGMVDYIATASKDQSTKVGCVIVDADRRILCTGYNGMTYGMDDDDPEKHKRPQKYSYFEHAERNAIYNAARNGIPVKDGILYVGWIPCINCARGIVQSGIQEVVIKDVSYGWDRWGDDFPVTMEILKAGGVKITADLVELSNRGIEI